MNILFGYKKHDLEEKKWYRILRVIFKIYAWFCGIALLSIMLWGFIPAPYGWLQLLIIVPVVLIIFVVSINVIRYIFLYTILGPDRKDSSEGKI